MVQLILSCKPANQGHSQDYDYIKGVLNLADLCSAQAQIHHLGKHLSTIDNARHPVCDDSHIINVKSLGLCVLYPTEC